MGSYPPSNSSLQKFHEDYLTTSKCGYTNVAMTNDEIDENQPINLNKDNHSSFRSIRSNLFKTKAKIVINRDALDFHDFHDKYEKRKIKRFSLKNQGVEFLKKSCDDCSLLSWLLSFFPFLIWIRNYSIKSYLIPDIMSGFTISVLHIPQGLAYGLLAGVGAINGLYVSFFPVLIYFFMGTSRHISIGMLNIVGLTFQYKKLPNIAFISACRKD